MLVLSRKKNEEIIVGDDIRITVVRIAGNRVALSIRAPDATHILRGELLNRPFIEEREPELELACADGFR